MHLPIRFLADCFPITYVWCFLYDFLFRLWKSASAVTCNGSWRQVYLNTPHPHFHGMWEPQTNPYGLSTHITYTVRMYLRAFSHSTLGCSGGHWMVWSAWLWIGCVYHSCIVCAGCYISRASYVRAGEQSLDGLYKPYHLVVYYRFLRFFSDGELWELPFNCVGCAGWIIML